MDLEADWQDLESVSGLIETLLDDIIHNDNLTLQEIKLKARHCAKAINRYTEMTNQNIHLLHEQSYYMLKRMQSALQEKNKADSTLNNANDGSIH